MTENLVCKTISEIKHDIEALASVRFGKGKLIGQLLEKVNLLEKAVILNGINVLNIQENVPTLEQSEQPKPQMPEQPKEEVEDPVIPNRNFTLEELSEYNGRNENPLYVAFDGIVYDVTNSKLWKDGLHFGLPGGKDLTIEFEACHSNRLPLKSMTPIGRLYPKP